MSNPTEVVIGLDIGTTNAKALVRGLVGGQHALVEARTPWTTVSKGRTIDAQVLTDLAWRWQLPRDTTATVAITNLFDQDPSYARLDLGYDPFTGDPLGRTYKLSLRKKF